MLSAYGDGRGTVDRGKSSRKRKREAEKLEHHLLKKDAEPHAPPPPTFCGPQTQLRAHVGQTRRSGEPHPRWCSPVPYHGITRSDPRLHRFIPLSKSMEESCYSAMGMVAVQWTVASPPGCVSAKRKSS